MICELKSRQNFVIYETHASFSPCKKSFSKGRALVSLIIMSKQKFKTSDLSAADFLGGQLLIAMPGMKDPRFERAVILMCAHSNDGAMGIILNQPDSEINFGDLIDQLEISDDEKLSSLEGNLAYKPVHVGGPVDTRRGFVLHSADYNAEKSTLSIKSGVCLTATVDICVPLPVTKGQPGLFWRLVMQAGLQGSSKMSWLQMAGCIAPLTRIWFLTPILMINMSALSLF